MIIGGEHFFTPRDLFKSSQQYINELYKGFQSEYDINFTFGGYYSILAIIDAMRTKINKDSIILLPSYLCPSILKPFKIRNVKYKFYEVDDDLFINLDHLISNIDSNVKAVFFIDYFGASQLERLKPVLNILKQRKITIIQDIVQCLRIKNEFLFGDYIFNSFRKFFPFEGSILLSKERVNINTNKKINKFVKFKRIGQLLRYLYVKHGVSSSNSFLYFFRKAEEHYYESEILKIPQFNMWQLNKIDFDSLENKQIHYFGRLFDYFHETMPGLLRKRDYLPLGFVMKVNKRDEIRKQLFCKNIFPPIHWKLPEEINRDLFTESFNLSSSILTIPLIGLTEEKVEYLIKNISVSLNK